MTLAQRSFGQLLIIASACLFSICNGFMKLLMNAGISKWAVFALRGAITVLLNLSLMFYFHGINGVVRVLLGRVEDSKNTTTGPPVAGYFIYVRGGLGAVSATLLIIVYEKFMTFSDSFAIFLGLLTLFSNMMAYLLLKEHVGGSTVVGAVLCVVGIMFVVRPPFLFGHITDQTQLHDAHHGTHEPPPPTALGVILLVISALFGSATQLFTRVLKDRSPQALLHGYMSVLGTEGLLAMLIFDQSRVMPSTTTTWLFLFGYIIVTQLGQILGAKGFQYETMSVASVLTNMEMGFAFLVDTVVLHERVTFLSLAGATAIFVGGGIVTFGNSKADHSTTSKESTEHISTQTSGQQHGSVRRIGNASESVALLSSDDVPV